jgi:hypothetical protein
VIRFLTPFLSTVIRFLTPFLSLFCPFFSVLVLNARQGVRRLAGHGACAPILSRGWAPLANDLHPSGIKTVVECRTLSCAPLDNDPRHSWTEELRGLPESGKVI